MRLIKLIWYFYFWTYVRIALSFYYRKIKISGQENIPKNAPVIFGSNHENALIDPLIMTTRFPMMIHYLVRADVFNNPLVRKFLNSLNLMPVYRIRDGVNSVKANEVIFKNCFKAFSKKEHLILFPEAAHDKRRQLKIAKKGIARIALGAMHEPNAPDELYIVPVGMNYSRHQTFRSAVHIVYGEPIKIEKIEESNENIEALRTKYDEAVAKCYVSFPREKFEVLDKIFFHDLSSTKPLDIAYFNEQASQIAKKIDQTTEELIISSAKLLEKEGMKFPFEKRKFYGFNLFLTIMFSPLALAGMVVHAPSLLVGWYIMRGIKDKVYTDTIYFGVGLVLVPVSWMGVGLWIASLGLGFGWTMGLCMMMPVALVSYNAMKKHWQLFRSNWQLNRSKSLQKHYQAFLALVSPFRA